MFPDNVLNLCADSYHSHMAESNHRAVKHKHNLPPSTGNDYLKSVQDPINDNLVANLACKLYNAHTKLISGMIQKLHRDDMQCSINPAIQYPSVT